ncbi:hypothetical protein DFH11DRAFT_1272107 [Phellopilus nigrolimitatus]|nr:hypothetical protein DFH11DRAFT_1272107 [Phellopilus nigrolimitatus]
MSLLKNLVESNNECFTNLTIEQRIGLSFVVIASFFSLFAVLGTIVLYLQDLARAIRESPGAWSPLRTDIDAYFLSLLLADALVALGGIMNLRWIMQSRSICGGYCSTQGVLQQAGTPAVALSTLAITFHTFFVIFFRWTPPSTRLLGLSVIIGIWTFLTLLVLLPILFTQYDKKQFYTPTPTWCYISQSHGILRVTAGYAYAWLAALGEVVVYGLLWARLRGCITVELGGNGRRQRDERRRSTRIRWSGWAGSRAIGMETTEASGREGRNEDSRRAQNEARKMLWYPLCYIIIILPLSVTRWTSFLAHSSQQRTEIPFALTAAVEALFKLGGLADVLLFAITRPNILLFGSWRDVGRRGDALGRRREDRRSAGWLGVWSRSWSRSREDNAVGFELRRTSGGGDGESGRIMRDVHGFVPDQAIDNILFSNSETSEDYAADSDSAGISFPGEASVLDHELQANLEPDAAELARPLPSKSKFTPLTVDIPSPRVSSVFGTWVEMQRVEHVLESSGEDAGLRYHSHVNGRCVRTGPKAYANSNSGNAGDSRDGGDGGAVQDNSHVPNSKLGLQLGRESVEDPMLQLAMLSAQGEVAQRRRVQEGMDPFSASVSKIGGVPGQEGAENRYTESRALIREEKLFELHPEMLPDTPQDPLQEHLPRLKALHSPMSPSLSLSTAASASVPNSSPHVQRHPRGPRPLPPSRPCTTSFSSVPSTLDYDPFSSSASGSRSANTPVQNLCPPRLTVATDKPHPSLYIPPQQSARPPRDCTSLTSIRVVHDRDLPPSGSASSQHSASAGTSISPRSRHRTLVRREEKKGKGKYVSFIEID